jgi:UDP:flavonoid glycosyltransferase YjiC (YdhE family)
LKIFETAWERYWKPFRAFESELGLPRSRNPILSGHSPQLALALFSPLLAAPQPDWPPNSHATGFPFLDAEQETSSELRRFLDEGDPPIVFTLGSAAVAAAGDFFSQSVEAARLLGRRAVLLTGGDTGKQATSRTSREVIEVRYAPHSAVFPRACVNVHHGGIGTTAEAMRAARPMLVVPYTHDQPDHAHRLKKIGVARIIPRSHYRAQVAAREIDVLMHDRGYSERSSVVGSRIRAESGTTAACDLLERLLGVTGTATRGATGRMRV